jgi:hypothetical protein
VGRFITFHKCPAKYFEVFEHRVAPNMAAFVSFVMNFTTTIIITGGVKWGAGY